MLEEGLIVGIGWDKLCTLAGIFDRDIASDGTALIKKETIILEMDVRNRRIVSNSICGTSRTGT